MAVSAEHVRSLHRYELRVLKVIERLMKRYSWVPLDQIKNTGGLSESETSYRLSRLMEWGMVRFNAVPYDGYALVFGGYDALALQALTKKGTISALGSPIGEGKESVVHEALGLCPVAIKFHRVGGRSFASARMNREYMPDDGHYPWIFASRRSAERENAALTLLQAKVSVPLPIDHNRHALVMSLVNGLNLNRCRVEHPKEVLDDILDNVRLSYQLGIIHADLSEFNVMIEEGRCVIIDWPQWVEVDHPNAQQFVVKDLENIIAFFKRKYNFAYRFEDALKCVIG